MNGLKNFAALVCICLAALLLAGQSLAAEDHVVSGADLHQAVISSAAARKKNIQQVEGFLSSKPVKKIVKQSGFDLKQVQQAVPSLSDQELVQLAKTTRKAQNDFAAGALTHTEITLIIVGAIIVAIILALKA